jgi:starvation-inducible DNA-binding protein
MTTRPASRPISGNQIQSFPVPSQLATVTDLKPQGTQEITEALNPLVADLFALYVKTKNFHWHLSGSHFRDHHLLLDEHANQIIAAIDSLAERVRRIGGTTVRSISHISQLQTIQDNNEGFMSPADMLRVLMEDNNHLVQAQRAAHKICQRNDDVATASLLEVTINEAERRKWFLFETSQGSNTPR